MREYLREELRDKQWSDAAWAHAGHSDVVHEIETIHDGLRNFGEDDAADELDSNWWAGTAYCHGDLSAEEIASMLLDGFDIGAQP